MDLTSQPRGRGKSGLLKISQPSIKIDSISGKFVGDMEEGNAHQSAFGAAYEDDDYDNSRESYSY